MHTNLNPLLKVFSHFTQFYSLYKHFYSVTCPLQIFWFYKKTYLKTIRQAKKRNFIREFPKINLFVASAFFLLAARFYPLFSLYTIQLYFIVNQYKNKPLYLFNLHNIIVHIDVTNVKNLTNFSCQSFSILSFCVFCIKTSVYFVQNQSL